MPFSLQETHAQVAQIIAAKLKIPAERVVTQATFKDLGADSLDIVEIIMAFEDSFGLTISDQDAEKIKTIGQAVELINQARTK